MKVRNGFVSNSSTSSFLVDKKAKKVYFYPYGEYTGIIQEMDANDPFVAELLEFAEKQQKEQVGVLYNENKERFCFK